MWIKLFIVIIVVAIVFFIVFTLVRSQPPQEEPVEEEVIEESMEVPEDPPVIIVGSKLRGWENGRLSWIIEAEEMNLNKQSSRAICPNGMDLVVFDDNGETKATFSGNKGYINLDNNDFQLINNVEVYSSKGDRIESLGIIYRDQEKTLEGFALSKIFFGDNYIECEKFISDLDFENPVFEDILLGKFIIEDKN